MNKKLKILIIIVFCVALLIFISWKLNLAHSAKVICGSKNDCEYYKCRAELEKENTFNESPNWHLKYRECILEKQGDKK